MSIVLLCAALIAGYLLGTHQVPARAYDATEDWANRRTSPVARWAVQPVYLLLIVIGFAAHPRRYINNVRAYRAEKRQAAAPRPNPNWPHPEEER